MIAAFALAALLAAVPEGAPSYADEIARWREQRERRLRSETGWLSVAGLTWLEPGENTVGSDPKSQVGLPADTPARAGILVLEGDTVTLRAAPGVSFTLGDRPVVESTAVPIDGEPLRLGRLSLQVIRRGGRYGVRLRDPESALRREFTGLDWFPVDEAWRVEGRFVPDAEARTVRIVNVMGHASEEPTPGVVEMTLGGRTVRLRPVIEDGDDSQWFYIFKDPTAPGETYGGGRFLYSAPAKDGRVVLDFNKAYNPPCAFNPYTTCPRPPRENELPVPVKAGEKKYNK